MHLDILVLATIYLLNISHHSYLSISCALEYLLKYSKYGHLHIFLSKVS